jgi:hypothetical protein
MVGSGGLGVGFIVDSSRIGILLRVDILNHWNFGIGYYMIMYREGRLPKLNSPTGCGFA